MIEGLGRNWDLTDGGGTRVNVVSDKTERPTDQGDINGPEGQS